MIWCPLHRGCACTCQRIWRGSITPINRDRAIRANTKHRRCAPFFQPDIDSGLAIICDVHSSDIHLAIRGLEVSQRPVPALANKPLMRWIIRQCGLCRQLFQCPRRDDRAVIVVKCNVTGYTSCSTASSLNVPNGRHKSIWIDKRVRRAALLPDSCCNLRQVSCICQIFSHQKLPPFALAISAAAHAPDTTRRNFPLSEAVTAGSSFGCT